MLDYKIEFTRLAAAIIKTRYSEDAIEELVRTTVEKHREDSEIDSISELAMMVVSPDEVGEGENLHDSKKTFLICRPKSDAVLHVDTCTFQSMGTMDAGPFAGKEVMMPVGDSDDRDDDELPM